MEKKTINHNPKQIEFIRELCSQYYKIIALYGGGRSGKTFVIAEQILKSCYLFPGIKVLILRESLSSGKTTIWDTIFKILNNYYPYNSPLYLDYGKFTSKKDRLGNKGSSNSKEGFLHFKNGSKIQIGGIQNIDKYLGGEYQIIYLNEASQLPESVFFGIHSITSRLTGFVPIPEKLHKYFQFDCSDVKSKVYSSEEYLFKNGLIVPFYMTNKNIENDNNKYAPLQIFIDFNPTYKTHWTYNLFIKKIDNKGNDYHDSHRMLVSKLNPYDNLHLSQDEYLSNFSDDESRKRFIEGEFLDESSVLLKFNSLKKYDSYPEFDEIFFTCDLASTDNKHSDYSVVCCWGVVDSGDNAEKNRYSIYLLDMHRKRTNIDEWIAFIENFLSFWTSEKMKSYGISYYYQKEFLLESTSNPILLKNTIGTYNDEIAFKIILRSKNKGGSNRLNRIRDIAPLINFDSVVYIPSENFEPPFDIDNNYLLEIMNTSDDFSFKKVSNKNLYIKKIINFIEDEFNSCKIKNNNVRSTKVIKDDIIDNFVDAVSLKYCLSYDEEREFYFRVEQLIHKQNA